MEMKRSESQPPYVVIAADLRRQILDGTYAPGARLPTAKDLAAQYKAAVMTVQSAVRLLREEGLVITQHGRGIFVSATPGEVSEGAEQSPGYAEIMRGIDTVIAELGRLDNRMRTLEETVEALQRGR
ncbi:GntR family transcriptional regulator [Kitasatospora purpeofusca]|uniref:GntR family transcriptional regulator n=1 Tax=Kitasatospora purpeofusca TaxID=67352 RepID=UPI00224D8859|nr:winged helix-turn-helix domain-containing protein [Kitasatospora purpeofusca]MCX4757830.1 winged helix-turn-helix domain-containing protein [Kitasatospora purpeofusca]WSR34476.1 winged helix-turn-helix domain-containing protein [Kitasatospora purpeofusca]